MNTKKSLVIIGPTASGKSDLALQIAQERNGEIISIDSRQIFKGMDIGTGKVTEEEQALVPHHLLDICNPGEKFNVTDFIKLAEEIEADIRSRDKLPIFCGGTLFWVESYLQKSQFPQVPPDFSLRKILEQKTTENLFQELQEKDPKRASTIDPQNKVRLIRALEIIATLGAVPEITQNTDWKDRYEIIILNPEREELRDRIRKRLEARLQNGMIEEVENLLKNGIPHEWLQKIGLEYKYISLFLEGRLGKAEMEEQLFHAIWHYGKRQQTYLKKLTE